MCARVAWVTAATLTWRSERDVNECVVQEHPLSFCTLIQAHASWSIHLVQSLLLFLLFIASTLQIAASLEVMFLLEPRSDSQSHLIYTLMFVRLWGRKKKPKGDQFNLENRPRPSQSLVSSTTCLTISMGDCEFVPDNATAIHAWELSKRNWPWEGQHTLALFTQLTQNNYIQHFI